MTIAEDTARYCDELGWSLVPLPAGEKAPTGVAAMKWNTVEKTISNAQAAFDYWTDNPTHNVGLWHGGSATVAFDVDKVDNTKLAFSAMGVDYNEIIRSGLRLIGNPDRMKVIFKVPKGISLSTHKLQWPISGTNKTEVVFELRGGKEQDVLPPSIHPDTQMPYRWGGAGPWAGIPEIPHQLLVLWQQWESVFSMQFKDVCPWKIEKPYRPPSKPRPKGDRTSVIDAFNQAHSMHELLESFGYKHTGRGRYLSPNSTSGLAGVILFEDDNAYSHHASDPFDSAHSFDCFDLWCQYQHLGDVGKAVSDAAKFLNITNEPEHEYDQEAIDHGARVAAAILPSRQVSVDRGPLSDIPEHLLSVPGILQHAVNFYNTTAPRDQPQFAVQTALAFGSVIMGRRHVTDQFNYTSLYFVNVGKSAAGKEHAKTTLERILEACGLDSLIGPSGYTSASGVFSALVDQPAHISIIDELGRVLASSQASGNQHKADAQTILMEVFGRQASTLRPQGYSKMGMSKSQAQEFDKVVRNPSLTIMSMTTPSTLYDTLSSRYVSDGFLGRFIIVESHIGRQVAKPMKKIPVSESLVEWAKEAHTGAISDLGSGSYDMPPNALETPFHALCGATLMQCDRDMIGLMDQYEKMGLEAMFGRTKEIAHRLALIVARSKGEKEISVDSLQWAIDYATFYAKRTVEALRKSIADGPFEAACKAVFAAIEKSGLKGMTERDLSRAVRGYATLEPRKRKEVLEALASDRGVSLRKSEGGGRPRMAWIAAGEDE